MNESLLNRILKDHKRRTRSLALILCLSMIVSLGTFAGFHQTAIAKVYTREILDCPYTHEGAEPVAHVHNDDCYDGETLICTLPEREAHTHTDECFTEQRVLVCGLEENPGHQHSEECFDENGELICQIPEGEGAHAHTDACYTIERALVCNQPELPVHVHDAGCFRTEEITVDEPEETAASEQAVSTVPEMPVSDPNADLETADDWNREFENLELSGNWARDLVLVAATQQGRGESPNNFEAVLNDAGDAWVRHGYTRYGAWYGYPYAEWDAMFVSFCLRYAGIPEENVPNNPTAAFMAESFSMGGLFAGRDYIPAVGDLIFFDTVVDDEITNIDHMGIVYHVDAENGTINTVEGDRTDAVATFGYYLNDEQIVGYGILPQNPNYIPVEGENTDNTDEAFDGFIFMTTDEEEEKQEETTTAEEAPVAEVPMPAQSWERTAGGIKVTVEAPEGAFPENTQIAVTPVNGSSLKDTVSDAVDGAVLEVQAVDITFFDADGREIEPAVPIRVTMTPAATEHAEEKANVVHVDIAQQTAELIEQAEGTEADNSEVVFDAEAFTIYAIVYTVDFEYEVNGQVYTSSMPGAQDIALDGILAELNVCDSAELETFLSKIVSAVSTDEEVVRVSEEDGRRTIRVLKDGDAQIVITMQDGAEFRIDVSAEGETSVETENVAISTVNGLYLPEEAAAKAAVVEGAEAIEAVKAETGESEGAAEIAYQVFDISLENVDSSEYDGFNVAVALDETINGNEFKLYRVQDGEATELTDTLRLNADEAGGVQIVSGFSFETARFHEFVMTCRIDTFFKSVTGETYKISLKYGEDAEIPGGAELKVEEILDGSVAYLKYVTQAENALEGVDKIGLARFFDISIIADGEEVQPAAPVTVTIELEDSLTEDAKAVHFVQTEEAEQVVVLNAENTENGIRFETDSFSVYGVITVPGPATANDLDGYSVTMSVGDSYLLSTVITDETPTKIRKGSEAAAAVWTFEKEDDGYNIYTEVNGNRQYINIINNVQGNNASVSLSADPQKLYVQKNEYSGTYGIYFNDNGTRYYLNQFEGNKGSGFAAWHDNDNNGNDNNSRIVFNFTTPLTQAGKEYMVVVKQGDSYYIVLNDGTLSSVQYDEEDNSVTVDNPMLWYFNGDHLYHDSTQVGYNDQDLPSDSYYRYIDPSSTTALNEDNASNTTNDGTASGSGAGPKITSRSLWNQTALTYADNKLKSGSNSYYIGVVKEGGTLKLKGQVSEDEAATIFFADAVKVDPVGWQNHVVNHIDISIRGTAAADVPLAYGKYYDADHNVKLDVTSFAKIHLTEEEVVNQNQLAVTPEDMKRSTINAYLADGTNLNDAFYVSGYSANPVHESSTAQVRVEGAFKVANLDGTDYEVVNTALYNEKNGDNLTEAAEAYRTAVHTARLNNRIHYSVTVIKPITFNLVYTESVANPEDPDNPITVKTQLYDADGKPLTITADVAFSASFDYWDSRNECPPIHDAAYGYNAQWKTGGIPNHNLSGMDFKLGADSETTAKVYAVEITKIVVDENGNRIKSDDAGTNKFYIYKNSDGVSAMTYDSAVTSYVQPDYDDVKDLDIGSFTQTPDYSGYSLQHEKTISVGSEGLGLVYDYDVQPGRYYIKEDPTSIIDQITDISGKTWDYKNTYILTEYAWRNHANDNYMHVSDTFTKKISGEYEAADYSGIPEILGLHYGYNGTDGPYTNDFLEFYVYNVYESPKVDVPVIKSWPDFDGEGHENYDWQVSFKLQWAPLYEGEARPSVSFQDVTPVQTMTINKSDMAGITQELVNRYLSGDTTLTPQEIDKIEAITFKNLPKFGTDSNGNTFRYQYSLEETSYRVTNAATGVILYSWSETDGYNDPDESTHYHPFYPHDAGETEEGNMAEENEADTNYYVDVTNARRNISQKEDIDVTLDKQWDINDDGTSDTRDETYWAEFELRRFVHTEHRDLSHMSDSDRVADPFTITIKNGDDVVNTLQVQPNVGLYLGGNFLPHDSEKTVTFTSDHPVRLANDSRVSTLTVTAEGENQSNALVRSQEFFVTQDTVFTIASGAENLVTGNLAKVLDTGVGTSPLPDRSFSQTILLDSSNDWHAALDDLLRSETSAGDNDDQENVTFYEYYLVEKDSNPKGYAQYFRADSNGNITTVLSGDSDHQIEHDDSIIALNGPSNRLIVKKLWRGVPDTTGFPAVTFTLYQAWADGNEGWVYENPDTHACYEHIELKGNSLEWICPETLPTTRLDGSTSRAVKYYVVEDVREGSVSKDGITTSWKFYYYLSSYYKLEGNEEVAETKRTSSGNQGYWAFVPGSDLARSGGTITICNQLNKYEQLLINKKFFELKESGSWDDTTAHTERMTNTVLGFRLLRAVKTSDGKYLNENGQVSETVVWMDYGDEMLVGYGATRQEVILDNGGNDFHLEDAGGEWHFRIKDNQEPGGGTNEQVGLPRYGFYIRNGEDIPVEYEYTYRETNVYKDRDRTPYPEWDWYSTILPMELKPDYLGRVENAVANYQASDLIIDKEWIGDPAASAVYVKIWRTSGDGAPEDFTAIIAKDIRNNNNWQMYVNNPAEVDLNRNALIIRPDSNGVWEDAIKVNRALLGALSETGKYHYYIQEVGYRTLSGEYRTNVNGTFKPLYDKWVGTADEGAYTGAPVGMNDYASNNITIGKKGENRLKVINSTEPSTSYTVTKAFHGPQSSTSGQSSVTGKYPTDRSKQVVVELQQRYRYEKTEGGEDYVSADNVDWVNADSEEAETIWTVDWQAAESASPVSIALPLDKPAGSILSDEAWYGSAAAWTYTWEGLDVTKTLADEADPNNSRIAQLYYRAVEVSTPGWFNSVIAAEEQNGHMAVDDSSQTAANTVTNERNDINLNLNKVWTGLGEGKTWPEGVTIDYQLVQHFHLALADMSGLDEDGVIAPVYSTGKIFKSVDMTTTNSGASTADSVHPQATGINVGKPNDDTTVIARITGLPVYGFLTATAEDVAEAAEAGVVLTEGTVYPVVYTYSAKETAVKKNGNLIGFKSQTVDAELDETITSPVTYKATLTNELVSVTVEKEWNGFTPSTEESATIQLRRFKKDIEPEPETTFPVTVKVSEWGSGIDANNNGHITVTFSAEEKESCSVILNQANEWSSVMNLDKEASWNASYVGDGTVLDATVEIISGPTENITEETEIELKGNKVETPTTTVNIYCSYWYKDPNWSGASAPNDGYIDVAIIANGGNGDTVFAERLDNSNGWKIDGITIPKTNTQYKVVLAKDGNTVIETNFAANEYFQNEDTVDVKYQAKVSSGGETTQTTKFIGVNLPNENINSQWGTLWDNRNSLTVGEAYSYSIQVQKIGTFSNYSVTFSGANGRVTQANDYGNSEQIHMSVTPSSAEVPVEIYISFTGSRSLKTRALTSSRTLAAAPSFRESATITWTNNTAGLPEGANPDVDEVVATVTFSGTTWSKTWTELPKYSDDGKEYVYYAYETAYTGASGATALETTYSIEADGTIKVTNTPTFPDLGNLKVTKQQLYNGAPNSQAKDRTFTVGLFTDAEGQSRVNGTIDQTITINNGTGETTFTGLTAGTYYVFEIVNGSPVTSSGTQATITIDGYDYTVTYTDNPATVENGQTAEVAVENNQVPFTLDILKEDVNDHNKKLDGAIFTLHKLVYNSGTQKISYENAQGTSVTTANGGKAEFKDLALGYYEIVETKAPDGYIMTGSGTFYIKVTDSGIQMLTYVPDTDPEKWNATASSGSVTFTADQAASGTTAATNALATVSNTPGTQLPQTGGPGTALFTALGGLMTATVGAILTIRRKRKPAEG